MAATVLNPGTASSTVDHFRREGHGPGAPAKDPGYRLPASDRIDPTFRISYPGARAGETVKVFL